MSNKTSLPTKAELTALINVLEGGDDPLGETISAGELEDKDITELAGQLVVRIERGVSEMRASGEEIPAALSKTVQLLHSHLEQENEDVDPEEWIDRLLAGRMPPGRAKTDGRVAAFRSLRMDLLTEDDLRILKEMAEEIRSQKET
jgi:hypothetical protein